MKELIFIFHFRPIEHYPPIQNLLNYIEGNTPHRAICYSTYGQLKPLKGNQKVKLCRFGYSYASKAQLWLSYLVYNFLGLVQLILKKPQKVIYYETLSAFPIYLYRKYFNQKVEVYIHYHEYAKPQEFRNGSVIEAYFHKKEKYLYPIAAWISHTNEVRLKKFLKDENLAKDQSKHHTLPNYPSKKWAVPNKPYLEKSGPLKFVYVGHTLTPDSTYIEEILAYLKSIDGLKMELNIYCLLGNAYLDEIDQKQYNNLVVNVYAAQAYQSLPGILSQHHIGLVLYKASTQNYIYNAPNKLFEYLSCGLDVWYPQEMKGIHAYDNLNNPKIIRLNYARLDRADFEKMISRTKDYWEVLYYSENVYASFIENVLGNE